MEIDEPDFGRCQWVKLRRGGYYQCPDYACSSEGLCLYHLGEWRDREIERLGVDPAMEEDTRPMGFDTKSMGFHDKPRRNPHTDKYCKYTLNGKRCYGTFASAKTFKGFCPEHAPWNRHKFRYAYRLKPKGSLDKWHPPMGHRWPKRPQCKEILDSGRRCSRKIDPGFDDGYCYMHGPILGFDDEIRRNPYWHRREYRRKSIDEKIRLAYADYLLEPTRYNYDRLDQLIKLTGLPASTFIRDGMPPAPPRENPYGWW